jgi:hypothetical protein
MLHRSLLLCPCLAAAIAAQTTLVVDALGGPGTFPTIAAALAAAAPGDRVEIIAQPNATYAGFQTGLGVHLFGIGNPAVQPFTLTLLPAAQVFTAEGLQVMSGQIDLRDCAGAVHLESLVGYCDANGCSPAPALSVQRCSLLTANLCEFSGQQQPAVDAADSTLVLGECNGIGSDALLSSSWPASPALRLLRCTTTLAAGDWLGGSEDGALPAAPALLLVGGSIDLTGDVTRLSGGQLNVFAPAIDATGGVIRVDPAVALQPGSAGPAITGTAQVVTASIPFATIAVEGQNGTLVASAKFVPQTLGALLLGLPMPPIALGPYGDLWLLPGAIATLAIGNFDSRGKLARVLSIPSVPALRGIVVGVQAFGFGLSPTLPRFSNPAFGILD